MKLFKFNKDTLAEERNVFLEIMNELGKLEKENCDWATGESYSYRTELKDGEIKVEEIKTEDMYPIEHCSPNLEKADNLNNKE